MSQAFWQAKIWGLLHSSPLKPLEKLQNLEYLKQADSIASASDRALFDLISCQPTPQQSVTVSHLLSGEKLPLSCNWQTVRQLKDQIEEAIATQSPFKSITPPENVTIEQLKRQFWWLWRCLPEVIASTDSAQMLIPKAHILPDVSLWSHASLTAAMAGTLTGYGNNAEANGGDRPYLAVFSFTPVQELIKASRKMRDFWAGSWVLHYLSAKICWKLAQQYGPDSLIYPSLFQQPLIDHWLMEQWPDFQTWIAPENPQLEALRRRRLLTAGFPNVIVLLLPQQKVKAAMQTAHQTLTEEWLSLGAEVYDELHNRRQWMPELKQDNRTWQGWLKAQWQPYWTALPVGHSKAELQSPLDKSGSVPSNWLKQQNFASGFPCNKGLFELEESALLKAVSQNQSVTNDQKLSVNVGSWWPYVFDQLRFSLSSVKSARVWKLPTAFGPRSTISGFGPVVYPHDRQKRITETDASQFWGNQWEAELGDAETPEKQRMLAGLFDGREQLNASETLKRGLHKVLHFERVLNLKDEDAIAAAYPDLTAGVAGYLKSYQEFGAEQKAEVRPIREQHFIAVCGAIVDHSPWAEEVAKEMRGKWGIPWIDDKNEPKKYHSRLLNPGWLVEDAVTDELTSLRQQLKEALIVKDDAQIRSLRRSIITEKAGYREEIRSLINSYYPNNNPADWYVLAAGDGDGMRHWLKGKPLENYQDYMSDDLDIQAPDISDALKAVKDNMQKRMGPSTHAALSRSLLDFSNQLVPYLTEQRYAGRLIYSGGDDVLAYTNLWEWDQWLWDIRQCFRGAEDPKSEFDSTGDYWRRKTTATQPKPYVSDRPLFTLGKKATVSFGLVIAHNSVPLAIALENLWEAEDKAKKHFCETAKPEKAKDAVQVRVIYANGNILEATSKFGAFSWWQQLLPQAGDPDPKVTSALFEQAAQLWSQHPAPAYEALEPWTQVFCSRRDLFSNDKDALEKFRCRLEQFLQCLWCTTQENDQLTEIQNWLKLAAFTIRTRNITIKTPGGQL